MRSAAPLLMALCAAAIMPAHLHAQAIWTASPFTEIKMPIPDTRSSVGSISDAIVLGDGTVGVAVRLSDGRNRMPASMGMRFFDASGRPLQAGGAAGAVLLPMTYVEHIRQLPNDRIEVYGDRTRIVLNGRGERVEAAVAQPVSIRSGGSSSRGQPTVEFPLGNGTFVGYYTDSKGAKQKQWPLALKYVLTTPSKEIPLVELPFMEIKGLGYNLDGGEYYRTMMPPAFASRPMITVSNDRIYIAHNGTPEIKVYSYSGSKLPPIRLGRTASNVTAADVAAYRARELAAYTTRRDPRDPRTPTAIAQYKADLDSVAPKKTMPYFGNMLASTTGDLWVSDFQPDPSQPTKWTVLNNAGAAVARVTLPGNFMPSTITADRVAGITKIGAADQRVTVLKITR